MKFLKDHGVIYSVKEDVLHRMVAERVCNMQILVAEGRLVEYGIEGRFEILIDVSRIGKPKKLEDGSVDHKDLKKVINVSKGEELVRHIPPKPGKNGCTVFGKEIKADPPKDVDFSAGIGTEISEDDPDILVAASDGAVKINSKGMIEVRNVKVITGDIDYSTGNISFSGDLRIVGVVREGFKVEADGNLFISGSVEDAEVTSTGDMEIAGGAAGSGNGKLICGGNLRAHHLENFNVEASKGVIVKDSIVNSSVKTEEHLRARTIIGGDIEASHGIDVETIGTVAETKTVIKIGSAYFPTQQKHILQKEMKELENALETCKEKMFSSVKNDMDSEGNLINDDIAKLEALKEDKEKIVKKYTKQNHRLEEIDIKIKNNPNPIIKAKKVFPNTIVRFGLAKKTFKEKLNGVIISAADEKIVIRKS